MVSLPFSLQSRLPASLARLFEFSPFGGSRTRLRISFILAFVLVCLTLVFPFVRHNRLFDPKEKIHLTLEGEMADFQRTFIDEHAALGREDTAGRIYGNTLNKLEEVEGDLPATLRKTNFSPEYAQDTKATPYYYNPYPDYNSDAWKAANQGAYKQCRTPENFVTDSMVFRGKLDAFDVPSMGSYNVLQMDSNLCFERDTWLGPYATKATFWASEPVVDWDSVNWKDLQDACFRNNSDRYALRSSMKGGGVTRSVEDIRRVHSRNIPAQPNHSIETTKTVVSRDEATKSEVSGDETTKSEMSADETNIHRRSLVKRQARTAIILRAYSGIKFLENDKQNVRALINELSLRSGGEYEVFFLMQIKDGTLSKETAYKDLPKEFWDMVVVWNDREMAELYPEIPSDVNKVHVSQWFSVQKFALDYPDFEYYWNWELDSRFTGNHYDLLEKLVEFAKKQPRKGLWERNERYYIPSVHGDYDTKFRHSIEAAYGDDTVWGPAKIEGVSPIGPKPPVAHARDDSYQWGVGEDADYISLGPMFNPVNASWVDLNSVWGYQGFENTPRRATIGTQSRCSRRLLKTMHKETLKGNHIGSEMTPQSVALLHGFKAVYAPIPMFFDREWSGESLNRYFNPGPRGESGSTMLTPYGWGLEGRFEGSSWYYRTTLPMKLYNTFLGYEDTGIGGQQWEYANGRPCLPPVLLHPIKDVEKTKHGFASLSELPYDWS